MEDIYLLQKMIDESNYIVFFGGAGVSTESGIPDFRSQDGLYNQVYKYPPETILSNTFFYNNTKDFYEFYFDKMNILDAEPNVAHNYLSKLEQRGKLKAIVTQNIDGLHSKAGSKSIYELHGTIYKNHCTKCEKSFDVRDLFANKKYLCECGGLIKPNVVLYEEPLDEETLMSSIKHISNCDLLIVAGTSLNVYPAAGLLNYFKGKNLVIINKDNTSYDKKANLVINKPLKDVFTYLKI